MLSACVLFGSGCPDFTSADHFCETNGRCANEEDGGNDSGTVDGGPPNCCADNASCSPLTTLRSTAPASPQGIAVASNWIYWLQDDGSLWKSAPDGASAVALADAGFPGRRLIVDDTRVSWIAYGPNGLDGGLFSCFLDGGTLTAIVSAGKFLGGLTESAQTLYWVENNVLHLRPFDGGVSSTVPTVALGGVMSMAADPGTVFLAQAGSSDQISAVAVASPTLVALATGHVPQDMAFDGTYLYWIDQPDGGSAGVFRVLADGGLPQTLATAALQPLEAPQSIAVDASGVYWTIGGGGQRSGRVMTLPFDGGAPACIQSGLDSPYRLALDAQSVYWTDNLQGTIVRAAKR
jgi:hypothetical protein